MLITSFITANLKWIVLAVVLLVMLIVGYVADKTDFGRKKITKKAKKIDNPNAVEEINIEDFKDKTLGEMVTGKNEIGEVNEDLNVPFGDAPVEDASNDFHAPIDEYLNKPFGDALVEKTD